MELGISEASGPAARPPFDPELALVFEAIGDSAASMTPETTPAMRAVAAANTMSVADLRQRPELQLTENVLPGAGGRPDLEVLLVRPARREAPLPGIFFVHGGGYVLGSHLLGLDDVLDWVVDVGVVVVSVAYRLAPEHRYPAPLEDCYAGLLWMADRAEALGVDPDQLFLHGKSAGGGLAAGLALLARDRNGPDLAGQILLSPMLDDRAATPSSQELDGEGVWDRTANATGWAAYLGDAVGTAHVPAYAAPARASDLTGLPPTFLDVGSVETFRDEDVDFAVRLWRAGVAAELHVWPGAFHGFDGFAPTAALSLQARAARLAWFRRVLQHRRKLGGPVAVPTGHGAAADAAAEPSA